MDKTLTCGSAWSGRLLYLLVDKMTDIMDLLTRSNFFLANSLASANLHLRSTYLIIGYTISLAPKVMLRQPVCNLSLTLCLVAGFGKEEGEVKEIGAKRTN